MSNKRGLGRGLSALLDSNNTSEQHPNLSKELNPSVGSVNEIAITSIEVNPFQPRTQFDQTALEELATSIKELGLIQPVTVRDLGYGNYQLISGERRFRASQLAGLKNIPAYVRVANDHQMLEMALVENIQRENLDAIEIGLSYNRLIEECNITQEELSVKVGKQRSTIANYIRLLRLPGEIQMALRKNIISMGHARSIINISNAETQIRLFADIIKNELSVRDTEQLVKNINQHVPGKKKGITGPGNSPMPYQVQKLHNELLNKLGVKVDLKRLKNGKGVITIPFSSDAELEKIVNLFNS